MYICICACVYVQGEGYALRPCWERVPAQHTPKQCACDQRRTPSMLPWWVHAKLLVRVYLCVCAYASMCECVRMWVYVCAYVSILSFVSSLALFSQLTDDPTDFLATVVAFLRDLWVDVNASRCCRSVKGKDITGKDEFVNLRAR